MWELPCAYDLARSVFLLTELRQCWNKHTVWLQLEQAATTDGHAYLSSSLTSLPSRDIKKASQWNLGSYIPSSTVSKLRVDVKVIHMVKSSREAWGIWWKAVKAETCNLMKVCFTDQGPVSISMTDHPTRPFCYSQIAWDVARSDSLSCLLKQSPDLISFSS